MIKISKSIRLGVNIDHVATVRQARLGHEPDPVAAAVLCELAGADGITVHLREDRRHIQDRDVRLLRPVVRRLNLEMAASDEIASLACEVKPCEATLVPEKRQELTTEGGLDLIANRAQVEKVMKKLKPAGIIVSLFIDPDCNQIETARYSEAKTRVELDRELDELREATRMATELGMHVHMGHGLNYHNVQAVAAIPGVEELNIGHSIVSRAVLVGMERAVREMKIAIEEGIRTRPHR
ncbi:MAG: Pyridoxine 5-phosphate synthase [Planctomycetota bacterium]